MKQPKPGTLLIVLFFALGALATYHYYQEDDTAFEAARQASQAQFLSLPLGEMRYQVYGRGEAPAVVLIHSFNGYIESWNPNIGALVEAGYRVVTYDLWGRGLSARPRVDLDLEVFRHQLKTLLDHLGINRVQLAGSSFGCVIAADFALHYPDRVGKLLLVGPAGWPSASGKKNWLIETPVLGDLAFRYFGIEIMQPTVENYLYQKEDHQWAVEAWQKYASYPGFTRSALSTLRHAPVLDYSDSWGKLGPLGKPTLFIWGEEDVSFPFSNTHKIPDLIPQAEIVGIEGAAHWVNIEKPEPVNAALIAFLDQ